MQITQKIALATSGVLLAGSACSAEAEPTPAAIAQDVSVNFGGTVSEILPDQSREGHIVENRIGQVAASSMEETEDWIRAQYPTETLEDGALLLTIGRTLEDCQFRAVREGGGWSFGEAPGEFCQQIGKLASQELND
jgi:hypothetical protein